MPRTLELSSNKVRELLERDATTQAELLVENLVAKGQTLAFAESLTGGLLADAIVSVPGASKVFRGAAVTYATETKHTILGVDQQVLESKGAVDPTVALQMAHGAATIFGANYAVGTTGVAGPDPQDKKPVGTVYLGFWVNGSGSSIRLSLLPIVEHTGSEDSRDVAGTRAWIRHATVHIACGVLADFIREDC